MLSAIKIAAVLIALVAVAAIVARICFALPTGAQRHASHALAPSSAGALAAMMARQPPRQAGSSGIAALASGEDAFAVRLFVINAAVSSIDAQQYIWRGDLTGILLLDALKRAADRSVRVRLLLDDNGTAGLDRQLAALNAQPNVEVRLHNPFNLRRLKWLSYSFDFFRLNRRMHNKSLTVDGHATVLGGRNVGDKYFDPGASALYVDLDVLAVGQTVADVPTDFDRYWAAPSAFEVAALLDPPTGEPIAEALGRFDGSAQLASYRAALEASATVTALAAGTVELEWTRAQLISDDPIKGIRPVRDADLLATRLMHVVGTVESRFDGVSPYFVPGASGVETFADFQARGIGVRILTNSLQATDVLPVHAGYAKRRRALLRAGIELFELRRQAEPTPETNPRFMIGQSGSSLNAKTFAVDGQRIFVGSLNFDPRSVYLNTEMGLLINSERMAQGVHRGFDERFGNLAWSIEARDGQLLWIDPSTGLASHTEPGAGPLQRVAITAIGWLSVEWLLQRDERCATP